MDAIADSTPALRVSESRGAWNPRFAAALLVLCLGFPAVAPGSAIGAAPLGIQGAGSSSVHVTNLDAAQDATMILELYRQGGGGAPVFLTRSNVVPGAAGAFDLPRESAVSLGAYAAIVSADRDIGLLVRHGWPQSGGLAYEVQAESSLETILPFATRGVMGGNSLATIMNPDTLDPVTVEVVLHTSGSTSAVLTQNYDILPGRSITLDFGRAPSFVSLPADWRGWARIRAASPIAVTSLVDLPDSLHAVYSVAALPAGSAAMRLHAPLLVGGTGEWVGESTIHVLNPGDASVAATLQLEGLTDACGDLPARTEVLSPAAIVSMAVPLPAGCAASGWIDSTGEILAVAVILEPGEGGDTGPVRAAGYPLRSVGDGGTRVALPFLRHGAVASGGVHATNVGDTEATVRLRLFDPNGVSVPCGEPCATVVAAGSTMRVGPQDLPLGFVGSGLLVADGPVLAAVLDGPVTGDLAAYEGLAGGSGPVSPVAMGPLALKGNAGVEAPTATPMPDTTPPGEATTTATSIATATSGTPTATSSPPGGGTPTRTAEATAIVTATVVATAVATATATETPEGPGPGTGTPASGPTSTTTVVPQPTPSETAEIPEPRMTIFLPHGVRR